MASSVLITFHPFQRTLHFSKAFLFPMERTNLPEVGVREWTQRIIALIGEQKEDHVKNKIQFFDSQMILSP